MDVCPLAKPSKLLVLDLVNQENDSSITEEQLIFGEVESNEEGGNTALRLTAAPDAPWNSFVDTTFDRLDLAVLFNNERAEVSLPKGATAADLICHLNFTYDLKFDVNEFDVVPQEDGELPELYKVTAKAGNMAYVGSVDVFADLDRMPLSARLLTTDLNGFKYPYRGPSLDHVVYDQDTDYSAFGNFGYYGRPNDPSLIPEYRRGALSGDNGEVKAYMMYEVPTYDPTLAANQSGVGRFYGPRDAVDGVVIIPQPKVALRQGNAEPVLLVGIQSSDGTTVLTTKGITDTYDATLRLVSGNGGSQRSVRTYTLIDAPERIDAIYWKADPDSAKAGSIDVMGVLSGGGTMIRTYDYPGTFNRSMPGVTAWSGSVDGRTIRRVFGEVEATLTLQRKVGPAEPIVLHLKMRTDPIEGAVGTLDKPAYFASQPVGLPNGLGVTNIPGDTGGLVDYAENGEVIVYNRAVQATAVSGEVRATPTRTPKTSIINTRMEPWRVSLGLSRDIDALGDDRVMKEYDIQLVSRSRPASNASWVTEIRDMVSRVDANGKLQYDLKLQGGTNAYNAGSRKIGEKNFWIASIQPNGNQSTAAIALADVPPFHKGLNVTQLGTGRYAYIGQTEHRWKLKRKDGKGAAIELVTLYDFKA